MNIEAPGISQSMNAFLTQPAKLYILSRVYGGSECLKEKEFVFFHFQSLQGTAHSAPSAVAVM